MTLDLFAGAFLVLVAIFGGMSGAIVQSARILAVVVAIVAADPLADFLRRQFYRTDGISSPLVEAAVFVTALVAVFVVVSLVGWIVAGIARRASDKLTVLDRAGGVALALVKGLLVLYVSVSLFVLIEPSLGQIDEDDALHLRDSRLIELVERYNLVLPWRFPDLERLHRAIEVEHRARTTGRESVVRSRRAASDVLRSDAMRGLTSDAATVRAALEDDYAASLADPVVRDRLNDDDFVARLREADWDELLREIEREGAETGGRLDTDEEQEAGRRPDGGSVP